MMALAGRALARVTCAAALAGLLAACAGPREAPMPPLPLQAHFDRAALVGHTTVMVYWASWCEFCERNLRDISALAARTPASRVRFVGLTADDDLSLVFVEANDGTGPGARRILAYAVR